MGIKGMMNVPFVIRLFSKSAGPQTFYVVEGFTAGTLLAALDKVGDTPVGLGAGGLVDLASILGRGRRVALVEGPGITAACHLEAQCITLRHRNRVMGARVGGQRERERKRASNKPTAEQSQPGLHQGQAGWQHMGPGRTEPVPRSHICRTSVEGQLAALWSTVGTDGRGRFRGLRSPRVAANASLRRLMEPLSGELVRHTMVSRLQTRDVRARA